jgi:hypothetical protein
MSTLRRAVSSHQEQGTFHGNDISGNQNVFATSTVINKRKKKALVGTQ